MAFDGSERGQSKLVTIKIGHINQTVPFRADFKLDNKARMHCFHPANRETSQVSRLTFLSQLSCAFSPCLNAFPAGWLVGWLAG